MDFVIAFALFLCAMLFCLIRDYALYWALAFALLLFFGVGLRRGYKAGALAKMAWSKMPKTMIVLRIIFLIGILTGLWRSCGTIAFCIYYGVRAIPPTLFVLLSFLLTALLSYALGTSFGVTSTAGVVLIALARSGGVNAAVTAGAIMSGVYFGDRGAPLREPRRRADGDAALPQRQAHAPHGAAAIYDLSCVLCDPVAPQPAFGRGRNAADRARGQL